jgi:CheY-like chemotaxis protein
VIRPDIVLCDIGLPGMNGYEVARAFRGDDVLRGTFLVALSGYAQADDIDRARAAGFDQHLAKPPTIERLKQTFAAYAPRAS